MEFVEREKTYALWIAMVGGFLTPFLGSSIVVALPRIGAEFGMGVVRQGWVAQSFLLASAMLLVPAGRLADIHGRKKIFMAGIALMTGASVLCGLAASEAALLAGRALQGFGGAMVFGTSMAIVTSVFPPGERGRAMGLSVAAVYLGLSLGPAAGGFLTAHLGWRAIFAAVIPLGLLALWMAARGLEGEWAEAKGERMDWLGSAIYGLSTAGVILGLAGLRQGHGLPLALAGLLGWLLFLAWEYRIPNPVFPARLFLGNRAFTFSNLAALINYAATSAVGFLLSQYLQSVRGLKADQAGLILICQPVMQVMLSPLAGRMSDKIEPRRVASWGMALTFLGLLFLSFLSAITPLPALMLCLLFLGVGFALFSSPNTNAVMSSVDKRLYGVASATLGTMRQMGQMLSLALVMTVLSFKMGAAPLEPGAYGLFQEGARLSFAIFTGLCLAGIFASLARGKVRE